MFTDFPSASCPGAERVLTNAPVQEMRNLSYLRIKATGDRILAGALLLYSAPLLLVVLLLVKLTSRGPALYSQTRLGLGGRPFTIYKVRTMRFNCERLTGACWSPRRDPRVTPLGRVLRATHLDELPQLWNVLRGEMSLIGPRPERPEFVRKLQLAIPEYPLRMEVRPGITGLAQVQLPPDTSLDDVRRKVACDLLYIERLGPRVDFRILLATAATLTGIRFSIINTLLRLPVPEAAEPVEDATEPAKAAEPVAAARIV